MSEPRLFVDGRPATPLDLQHQALVNYGAYTSFRVERGGVRGLDRHLARLNQAAVELFGAGTDEGRVRNGMRGALGGLANAWMRVSLFSNRIGHRDPTFVGVPNVMVGVFEVPPPLSERPLRAMPFLLEREAPHLKSLATFGLMRARRAARAAGFDDALLVDRTGLICEGTLWNLGFWCGDALVWPEAPMLDGVTQAILRDSLGGERRAIRVQELADFDAAFLCNSATPACAIAAIGETTFDLDPHRLDRLKAAWESAPVQPI